MSAGVSFSVLTCESEGLGLNFVEFCNSGLASCRYHQNVTKIRICYVVINYSESIISGF